MRTYTKTTLHKLVLELMRPERPPMPDEEINQWMECLPEITDNMTTVMRIMLFGATGNGRIRRYFGQIRRECTLLMDVLYQYPEFPERMMSLYQAVLQSLEQVLEHQERRYATYLDPMDMMPMLWYHQAAGRIEEQVKPLVSAMCTYNADKTLQALVVGKMTVLLKQRTDSLHKIGYLEQLQIWILELCKGSPGNITDRLKRLLLRQNFNSTGFMVYCKEQIDQDVAKYFEIADKYDCLLEYKLELQSITHGRKTLAFEPGKPGTREVLLGYVKAALDCMDAKRALLKPLAAPPEPEALQRLPIAMSVDVLAYFFKLLVGAGVVTGVKKSVLVLFISRSFQTSGIGNANLSLQSIESKYRQVVKNTAITVKSILLKMLKQLDEEFG